MMKGKLLLIIDRDGTIIKNDNYLGQSDKWKQELVLNQPVIKCLRYIQIQHQTVVLVVSNQAGVAKGLMTRRRVKEINHYLNMKLMQQNIRIDDWYFCAEVDVDYTKKHPEIKWIKKYIKKISKRKPSPSMVYDALIKLNLKISYFKKKIVIGNYIDDQLLANNLGAYYIDVKNRNYLQLLLSLQKFNL